MRPLDWIVLIGSLVFIVGYGMWRTRGTKTLEGFLLANRSLSWPAITMGIMATQASAITFLSTPGQGFADGMRFLQFYFGLPLAMIVLSAVAVPIYHRLKVFTAYEYLETRFDVKTRTLAATLFLIQRGLAAGLTIFAPALVLSVMLGWSLYWTNLLIGTLVILYTTSGGNRAVSYTQKYQMTIMLTGLFVALLLILRALPSDLSFGEALAVAGKSGKLNVVNFSFDLNDRYTFWTGILGGFFLQLSYFGTDQSQVGRYLTGRSTTESKLGLLANGLVKVPLQFFILFLGAMVFVFYVFVQPPIHFNPVEVEKLREGPHAAELVKIEADYDRAFEVRRERVRDLVDAKRSGAPGALTAAGEQLEQAQAQVDEARGRAVSLMKQDDAGTQTSETNYVFLSFILSVFPAGAVGLLLALIFAASMSSTAAELNALASTSSVDVGRRFFGKDWDEKRQLAFSRAATVFWGIFAIAFAMFANRLGALIEAINILGSLVYGTILGIFMTAFFIKRVGGTAVFVAAMIAEVLVIACFLFTDISFLWYNVVGCMGVILVSLLLAPIWPKRANESGA